MIKQPQEVTKRRRSPIIRFLLFFCLLVAASCSTSTRQLFFDIPPPSAEKLAREAREQAALEAELNGANDQEVNEKYSLSGATDDNLPRPEIESLQNWDQVLEALPKVQRLSLKGIHLQAQSEDDQVELVFYVPVN